MPTMLDSSPSKRPAIPSACMIRRTAPSVDSLPCFFVSTWARVDRLTSGYVTAMDRAPPAAPAKAWIPESDIILVPAGLSWLVRDLEAPCAFSNAGFLLPKAESSLRSTFTSHSEPTVGKYSSSDTHSIWLWLAPGLHCRACTAVHLLDQHIADMLSS